MTLDFKNQAFLSLSDKKERVRRGTFTSALPSLFSSEEKKGSSFLRKEPVLDVSGVADVASELNNSATV